MGGFIGFLQALSTPAIAVAGVTIAYQQKRLANIRLRNDLFDRRFKIYEAARTYLVCATRNQRLPVEDMIAFSRDTSRISRIDAEGHVLVTTLNEIARGATGVYNVDTGIATLAGGVTITRGDNELRGQYGVVDLNNNVSRLLSAPPGGAAPRAPVQGLIIPRTKPPAPPAKSP